mgnify:CR=1 FL=1
MTPTIDGSSGIRKASETSGVDSREGRADDRQLDDEHEAAGIAPRASPSRAERATRRRAPAIALPTIDSTPTRADARVSRKWASRPLQDREQDEGLDPGRDGDGQGDARQPERPDQQRPPACS